jgi:hypothetical protein
MDILREVEVSMKCVACRYTHIKGGSNIPFSEIGVTGANGYNCENFAYSKEYHQVTIKRIRLFMCPCCGTV